MTRFVTAALVAAYADQVQGCDVQFRQFGGRRAFHGRIRTVRTFEDNALVRAAVSTPGEGAVLVIDGGASLRARSSNSGIEASRCGDVRAQRG